MYKLTVRCNCGYTIQFPLTKPPLSVLHRMTSSTGDLPANVLCPHCKHVFACSAVRFQAGWFQKTRPSQSREDQVCVCIRIECGVEGCESPINTLTAMTITDDMYEEALNILHESVLSKAVCGEGHELCGTALRAGKRPELLLYRVWDGLDWKSLPQRRK